MFSYSSEISILRDAILKEENYYLINLLVTFKKMNTKRNEIQYPMTL